MSANGTKLFGGRQDCQKNCRKALRKSAGRQMMIKYMCICVYACMAKDAHKPLLILLLMKFRASELMTIIQE